MKNNIKILAISLLFLSTNVFGFGQRNPTQPPQTANLCVGPFEVAGKYAVTKETNTGPTGRFTLYRPTTLEANHPILTWGNGTYATPDSYDELLRHFASHGFVVIASNSTQTGSGREMLEGAKWMVAQNSLSTSKFYNHLDALSVGATGHSQGGGGTVAAGVDPIIKATAPIQPAYYGSAAAQNKGPMFLTAGSSDSIVPVSTVNRTYQDSAVQTVYGILSGASHFEPVGNAGRFRGYLTAWFAMQLSKSAAAGEVFNSSTCGISADTRWKVQRKN